MSIGREEFLQDPDSYNLAPEDSFTSAESEGPAMSPRSGGYLTDRANSPSVASVTSIQSVSSQVSTTGRRFLEWDSAADLGGSWTHQSQIEAAQSLSTLEKLTIENYSEFLREEPEGKSSQVKDKKSSRGPALPPPPGGGNDTEMREMRLHKFADSLMRQRQIREQEIARQHRRSRSREGRRSQSRERRRSQDSQDGRARRSLSRESRDTRKRRSLSRDAVEGKGKSGESEGKQRTELSQSSSTETSSSRDSKSLEVKKVPAGLGSPLKSCSLSDVRQLESMGPESCQASRSSTDIASRQGPSGPSSSSSAATIVNAEKDISPDHSELVGISTDPMSLPPHLQDLVIVTGGLRGSDAAARDVSYVTSQASLSSRQSASRSFETVIGVEPISNDRTPESGNNEGSDLFDTEDEIQAVRNAYYNQREETPDGGSPIEGGGAVWRPVPVLPPKHAWQDRSSGSQSLELVAGPMSLPVDVSALPKFGNSPDDSLPRRRRHRVTQSSEPSSVPTTSEDEEGGHRRQQPDSSTMESTRMVDRAKSFEYFPGESFPIQENSSSYEYLPGHLVNEQRPPTVLNRRPDSEVSSLLAETSSVYSSLGQEHRRNENNREETDGGRNEETDQGANNLDGVQAELRKRSENLLSANISQTKHFFKKLKKYIDFLSTPSLTAADCRVKQELADRIVGLLANEESRMDSSSRPVSTADNSQPSTLSRNTFELRSGDQRTSVSGAEGPSRTGEPGKRSANQGHRSIEPVNTEPTTRAVETEPTLPLGSGRTSEIRNMSGATSSDLSLESSRGAKSPGKLNWRTAKTRSEEKYEQRKSRKDEKTFSSGKEVELIQALHRQRLQHMRKLKKEIRNLEKLESLVLGKKPIDDLSSTEVSGMSSISTARSILPESSPELMPRMDLPRNLSSVRDKTSHTSAKIRLERLGTEGKSASGSETKKSNKKPKSPKKVMKNVGTLQDKEEIKVRLTTRNSTDKVQATKSVATETELAPKVAVGSDFGQMFPTPAPSDSEMSRSNSRSQSTYKKSSSHPISSKTISRPITNTSSSHPITSSSRSSQIGSHPSNPPNTSNQSNHPILKNPEMTNNRSIEIQTTMSFPDTFNSTSQTERDKENEEQLSLPDTYRSSERREKQHRHLPKAVKKQKPVAYYLPVDSLSPIRIGRRVLRESRYNSENGQYSLNNRNILSGYMASLSDNSSSLTRKPTLEVKSVSATPPGQVLKMTLQEALEARRPDFIRKSEQRVMALRKARGAREKLAARQAAWIEEIAAQSPRSRKFARPNFTPVKIERVFSHREMVASTRERCASLPEVVNRQYDTKREGKYRTNRIMAEIYARTLQKKVLRGKVSLTHHANIVVP